MRLVFFLTMALALFAQNIEISADRFEASEKEAISKFLGNVVVKRGKDILKADNTYIFFNKNKKPVKIEIIGNVIFDVRHKKSEYKGKAGKVFYFPLKKEYIFFENVEILQLPKGERIFAQRVYINLNENVVKVEGKKDRPVKFILKVKE